MAENQVQQQPPPLPPSSTDTTRLDWTPDMEIALLQAIVKWRPVGVHSHFRILNIHRFLVKQTRRPDITIDEVWRKLNAWYDMTGLEKTIQEQQDAMGEPLPSYHSERPFLRGLGEFALPGDEFESVIAEFRKATADSPLLSAKDRENEDDLFAASEEGPPPTPSPALPPVKVPAKRGPKPGSKRKSSREEVSAAPLAKLRNTRARSLSNSGPVERGGGRAEVSEAVESPPMTRQRKD